MEACTPPRLQDKIQALWLFLTPLKSDAHSDTAQNLVPERSFRLFPPRLNRVTV